MLIMLLLSCGTISASYELSVFKDIFMVDLYSDIVHNAPKNTSRLTHKIDFCMSI